MSRFLEKFADGGLKVVLALVVALLSSCAPSGPSAATEIERESVSVSTETDSEVPSSSSAPVRTLVTTSTFRRIAVIDSGATTVVPKTGTPGEITSGRVPEGFGACRVVGGMPIVDSEVLTTIVLDDGQVVEVVDYFVCNGVKIPGSGVASDEEMAEFFPSTTASPNADRVEDIKRQTNWPPPPPLVSARYAGSFWRVVDEPGDGVLLVAKVHEWYFGIGDEFSAAEIVTQLESSGWPGLGASRGSDGDYGVASDLVAGCGTELDCSVKVRPSTGEVLMYFERSVS